MSVNMCCRFCPFIFSMHVSLCRWGHTITRIALKSVSADTQLEDFEIYFLFKEYRYIEKHSGS
ncbi:hypothetical protein NC651_020631 [Populus alba x Populus x berolinensis]|nr:hypothetical protein NC651_020631 [Populus alba x Populus x berolinensis]